ncbi:MAG: hypothetical protein PF961_12420, partial [Planctomycetota bacterium]|nr:hypothetical protein [Planctomycetota bacterium]
MADNAPTAPETPDVTSYSDPLYDRMEVIARGIGKRWYLIVIIAILCSVAVLQLKARSENTPIAAGAHALRQARSEGIEALTALAGNEAVLSEWRARAALEAANLALGTGDLDSARSQLSVAKAQAEASALREVELTVLASQAAVAEQAEEFDVASSLYLEVADKTATGMLGLNLAATLGAGRCDLALAAASADAAEQTELRRSAYERFRFAGERSVEGAEQLVNYARFKRYELERAYPELADDDNAAVVDEAPIE